MSPTFDPLCCWCPQKLGWGVLGVSSRQLIRLVGYLCELCPDPWMLATMALLSHLVAVVISDRTNNFRGTHDGIIRRRASTALEVLRRFRRLSFVVVG